MVEMIPSLPGDFASRLLNLELELETNCSAVTVTALLGLYQQAIVYFEHFKTEDYRGYQHRLHSILQRKDVLAAMQNPCTECSSPVTICEKRAFFKRREALTPTALPTPSPKDSALLAKADLQSQQSALDHRLQTRKMTHRHSLTPKVHRTAFRFDDVANALEALHTVPEEPEAKERCSVDFLQLEEVMSLHFSEKANRLAEIRLKYELQIQELERTPSPLMSKVVAQVQTQLKEELAKATVEMDNRRKQALDTLKAQYRV